MHRMLLLIVLVFASSSVSAAQETMVWVTLGEDVFDRLNRTTGVLSTAFPLRAYDSRSGIVVTRLPERDLAVVSDLVHETTLRCGGFIVHESLEDAGRALEVASRTLLQVPVSDFTIDQQTQVGELLPELAAPNILSTIQHLSTTYDNRYYVNASGEQSALWIRDLWQGYAAGRSDVTVETVAHSGYVQPSVILTLEGTSVPDEVVVLGGHLDTKLTGASNGPTSVSPGADDNASGIAALSEVLRVLLANGFAPDRTVKFMGYAAEEVGLRGSGDIAADFAAAGIQVVAVMQLDMTDFNGSLDDIVLIDDFTDPTLTAFVVDLIEAYQPELQWTLSTCGYACSDHASWHNQGYPAAFPFEARFGEHNQAIHTPNDTLATLGNSAEHALKFSKLALSFAIEVGLKTPGCTGEACGNCLHDLDFESGAGGWINGVSSCTTGSFVVGVPDATAWQAGGGNPGNAFFTQPNPGGVGGDDVDGGTCEALSPVLDASAFAEVSVSLDYFHGQRDAGDDAGDGFLIEVLNDGVVVDTLVAVGDVTRNPVWATASTTVSSPGSLQLRVRVSDAVGGGDIVEAGLDNVRICSTELPPACQVDSDCDDGLFCNGTETCDAGTGTCRAGTVPSCDDGVACTVDACDEATDSCDHTPSNGLCSNGLFCDGVETCDAVLGCRLGSPPDCDDGVGCTVDSCDETNATCDHLPDDGACDDGLFCNGAETCHLTLDCQAGADPCAGGACDEAGDVCEGGGCSHAADFESGAGGWSPGADTCTTGSFIAGTPDATTWQVGGGNPGQAFFTANNPGGIGADDVDGGTCEALSPVVGCAGQAAAQVTLDYFHGQRDAGDDAGDGFTVEVLSDGVVVATLVSLGDLTTNPAWTTVSTTVLNPGALQVRVRASDAAGGGDIVEGGIDNVSIVAAALPACTVDDDFESGAAGWINDAASTCATGDYVLGDPTNPGGGQQIVGSHSGVNSLFTGVNTAGGTDDVDGGNCILGSPTWPVAEASTLSAWYWHGQRDAGDDAAGDFFLLEVSIDGGASWSTLASNGDAASTAAWSEATAAIPAGSDVRLRMQCSDGAGGGDLIECGLDDVSICR